MDERSCLGLTTFVRSVVVRVTRRLLYSWQLHNACHWIIQIFINIDRTNHKLLILLLFSSAPPAALCAMRQSKTSQWLRNNDIIILVALERFDLYFRCLDVKECPAGSEQLGANVWNSDPLFTHYFHMGVSDILDKFKGLPFNSLTLRSGVNLAPRGSMLSPQSVLMGRADVISQIIQFLTEMNYFGQKPLMYSNNGCGKKNIIVVNGKCNCEILCVSNFYTYTDVLSWTVCDFYHEENPFIFFWQVILQ